MTKGFLFDKEDDNLVWAQAVVFVGFLTFTAVLGLYLHHISHDNQSEAVLEEMFHRQEI